MKIGIGYDVHRLVDKRKLILGGVEIPYSKGLLGHSDADVLTHAVMDALLGALALGDIGEHFPNSDPKYQGISSLLLLEKVVQLVKKNGYRVLNSDSVIAAEEPKLRPYIEKIRCQLAAVLNIPIDGVSVKATTTEGLGFEGKKEGISAQAIVLLAKV